MKAKLIKTLKCNLALFNRYRSVVNVNIDLSEADLRRADLSGADLREADLRGADLRWANLSEADLRRADLSGADLREADLRGADLRWANLSEADLRRADLSGADLREADLRGADLDFAAWSLSCKSLRAKTDEKIRVQLMFHTLSLIKYSDNATDQELTIFEYCKEYANKFHRTDVERL